MSKIEKCGMKIKDCHFHKLHENTRKLFEKRCREREAVIDKIAEYLELPPEICGINLYELLPDDKSPIIDKIESFINNSGDKAKLKRRISELENENQVLNSILKK